MVNILLIKKNGSLNIAEYNEEQLDNLYKVAGLKNKKYFDCVTEWYVENDKSNSYNYCVYAKTNGKAGNENKYDFPPPIDNELYFDTCVIIKKKNNVLKSIRLNEWEFVYESLFGGFEDLGDEDSEEEEEELGPDDKLTKSGYLQDDFVVDDDEDLDEEYIDDDSDDDEFEDDDEYDSSEDEEGFEHEDADEDEDEDADGDEEGFEHEDEEDEENEDDVSSENAVSPERNTRKKSKPATVFDLMLPDKDSELSE
tara:strand:+ start:827 stop:1588 length:762 start_codon:yes stop_codon:yes gene_type:complete